MEPYIKKADIVAEIERRISELSQLEKASYEVGLFDAYKIILSFLNTLEVKKEPASEDLKEAATKYAQDKYLPVQTAQSFKAGAQWQKEQMIDKACNFLHHYQEYPNHDIATGSLIEAFKMFIEL